MSNKNIRIRTTPGGEDKYLKLKLDQEFDTLDVLSLRISQAEAYKRVCSDYGVIVGRVIANGGVGVPNAKVSIFIPLSDEDAEDDVISAIYPFTAINDDRGVDGKRYNLLPDYNSKNDECFTPIGSFPSKRKLLDNDVLLEVYEKYYKFTTTTNNAGDYMLFGVPVGNHTLHMDVDMSDIGVLSQKPYDLIREGADPKIFESSTKFKGSDDLDTLAQVKSFNTGINVIPFWGDTEECEIGINRHDFSLPTRIETFAFFMGSLFSDSEKNSISQFCRIKKKLGNLCDTVTGEGTIEMIRKNQDGLNEQFNVEGGRVIDEDGTWSYQIPMNLDYKVTDEFGNLVDSTVPNIGIPTRTDARFRISMDMTGDEGRYRRRAEYLVPNNPSSGQPDYTFDNNTPSSEFKSMYWNNIYTVRNFIGRFQAVKAGSIRSFVGIKDVDDCGSHTPFPYNRYDTDINPLFSILCIIVTILLTIVSIVNASVIWAINLVISAINGVIRLFGVKKISPVPCITIKCDEKDYLPGCSGRPLDKDAARDCLQTGLAESLNVFEFDFYNDWINGTLYFPQFKYKKKKSGKEKFCDADADNNRNNHIIDTCLNGPGSTSKVKTASVDIGNDGIIKKVDEKFYYVSKPKDNTGYHLLATDITNLGPIEECSPLLSNNFHAINGIPDTTYNRPPNARDIDEDNANFIWTSGVDGFLMDITCLRIKTKKEMCDNTKVICELGMGLDEASDDTGTLVSANEVLTEADLTNPDIRAKLISNNTNLPYDDTSTFVGGANYEAYREMVNKGPFRLSNNNSLYFYFGINPGKSAIQKFNSKYRTECIEEVETTFLIDIADKKDVTVINGNDGSVDIEIIGGSGSFQYNWYDSSGTLIGTNQDITNLEVGNYKVEVVDLITSKTAVREVEILGPIPLGLSYNTVPTSVFGASDGQIIADIIGGDEGTIGYTLEIIAGPTIPGSPLNPVDGITGPFPGNTFTNLKAGTYTIRVTDGLGVTIDVTGIEITEPPEFKITVDSEDTSCGEENGIIKITVSGGTSPYTITTTGTLPDNEYTVANIVSAKPDTYTIEVTDSDGSIKTDTVTILSSVDVVIDNVVTITTGLLTYQITVTASGGVGILTYTLSKDGVDQFDNIIGVFGGLTPGNYKVTVADEVGCIRVTDEIIL